MEVANIGLILGYDDKDDDGYVNPSRIDYLVDRFFELGSSLARAMYFDAILRDLPEYISEAFAHL